MLTRFEVNVFLLFEGHEMKECMGLPKEMCGEVCRLTTRRFLVGLVLNAFI